MPNMIEYKQLACNVSSSCPRSSGIVMAYTRFEAEKEIRNLDGNALGYLKKQITYPLSTSSLYILILLFIFP